MVAMRRNEWSRSPECASLPKLAPSSALGYFQGTVNAILPISILRCQCPSWDLAALTVTVVAATCLAHSAWICYATKISLNDRRNDLSGDDLDHSGTHRHHVP